MIIVIAIKIKIILHSRIPFKCLKIVDKINVRIRKYYTSFTMVYYFKHLRFNSKSPTVHTIILDFNFNNNLTNCLNILTIKLFLHNIIINQLFSQLFIIQFLIKAIYLH